MEGRYQDVLLLLRFSLLNEIAVEKIYNRKFVVFKSFSYLCIRKENGQVFYGQLPLNPPGWERSKGIRL